MEVYEIIKISREIMKVLSNSDIKVDDYQYLEMYDEYLSMKSCKEKYRYIIAVLSFKYNISQSTVSRIIKRFGNVVKS